MKALHKSSRSANGSMTARLKNLKRKQAKLATLIKGNKVILTQAVSIALRSARKDGRWGKACLLGKEGEANEYVRAHG